MNSDKAILSSALVTLTSTTAASFMPTKYGGKGSIPEPRLLVATGLTFFGLSMLNDAVPAVAGPLALGIAFTAFTYYGLPMLDNYFVQGKAKNPIGQPTPYTTNP
jgi:hypothetical protein